MTDPADFAGTPDSPALLNGLHLKPGYDSSDRILETFYVPALSRAVTYDRSVGYFRSSSLSVAAKGLSRFLNGGGKVRLLCGAEITAVDRDALMGRSTLDGPFAEKLAAGLVTAEEVDRRRLEVLAWLASHRRLEVRIALAVDEAGHPLEGGGTEPYFHEKIGVLRDVAGNGVAFQGSVNESATAWTRNFESFSVYASWDASSGFFNFWAAKFEDHWRGQITGFKVYPLPEAVRAALVRLAPAVEPGERDPEEPPPQGDDAVVAHYLSVLPRSVQVGNTLEATAGVGLFPHQRQVVERLAGLYPRSWLVADEVGLGKTISAGMALRRLVLSGRVRRALILAPANVCRQWQDELFEKFGLWVPRLDGGRVYPACSLDPPIPVGANPYAEYPVLIASSHLARRPAHQELVLEGAPYDLVVVDEAHHARRTHFEDDRYRPGRLLELLDRVQSSAATRCLWLLTATPMQLNHTELADLLRLIGLEPGLSNPEAFGRYYAELAKTDDATTGWDWLARATRAEGALPATPAEEAVMAGIRARVGPISAALIESFSRGDRRGREVVASLPSTDIPELRRWLRAIGPVGRHVTRHSRRTLLLYRQRGLLSENLATRDVVPCVIRFTPAEQNVYDSLDDLIGRLMEAHGSRKGVGFVLTVYRRRLTSSWAAISATLARRIAQESLTPDEIAELEEELEDEDTTPDQAAALPLSTDDAQRVSDLIDQIKSLPDSKFDRLRHDLDEARGAGHSTIVFTQFTDTLRDLRDRLVGAYRSQLATFTGDGGQIFRDAEGWVDLSKRDLVEAIRAGQVTVLLATDAASEGLNLQSASYLINYDAPWNPMRLEQRIGRIDRLGQVRDVVHVRTYFIRDTVEEAVYAALAGRIDSFHLHLGNLQPVLGATERAFQSVFRAPRSERASAQAQAIGHLIGQIGDLEASGLRFDDDDAWPLGQPPPPAVGLDDLREVLVERFAARLDADDRPVTWSPERVSRDREAFVALGTYGHPRLLPELARIRGSAAPPATSLVVADSDGVAAVVRADRTPPVPVASLAEVDELGSPAARGEAEALSRHLVEEELRRRQEYESTILAGRLRQQTEAVRARFLVWAREAVAAGCAASRFGGRPGADPIAVWHELGSDASVLSYAETLRQRLDVPITRVIDPVLANQLAPLSPEAWALRRHRAGEELQHLFDELGQI